MLPLQADQVSLSQPIPNHDLLTAQEGPSEAALGEPVWGGTVIGQPLRTQCTSRDTPTPAPRCSLAGCHCKSSRSLPRLSSARSPSRTVPWEMPGRAMATQERKAAGRGHALRGAHVSTGGVGVQGRRAGQGPGSCGPGGPASSVPSARSLWREGWGAPGSLANLGAEAMPGHRGHPADHGPVAEGRTSTARATAAAQGRRTALRGGRCCGCLLCGGPSGRSEEDVKRLPLLLF